jgi:hypothetical protein
MSESDGSRDFSPAESLSFEDGSREAARPDFVRCLMLLEIGSTMTVSVFLRFFFDDVALALELLTGLKSWGDLPPAFCAPGVEFCDLLNRFSEWEVTVVVTCTVEGLRGFPDALASEGTSLSEACLEFIIVAPFTIDLVLSVADRLVPKNFPKPILSNEGPVLWVLADWLPVPFTLIFKSLTPFVSGWTDVGESGAVTSIVGWAVCEEIGSGGAVYPLDVALARGVLFCGVGGRALIFGMSLAEVGVELGEVVWGTGFLGVVSFFDWETLLVPFVLDSEALTGKIGCLSWDGWRWDDCD